MSTADANGRPQVQKPHSRWLQVALVIVLCPLWFPLLIFAFLMLVVVGLPIVLFHALVVEPIRLRKHIDRRGRVLDEAECIARLSRGEGTLLIEDLGGKMSRAWWTPEVVPPIPEVDFESLEDDFNEEDISEELWAAVKQTQAAIKTYTDLEGGSAVLVRRKHGAQLGAELRRSIGGDRIVRLCTWVIDLERDFSECWECGYDLTGLEGSICPECGTNLGRTTAEADVTKADATAASRAA